MSILRKRRPGSMFKRLFILMTATVLFCVFVASFSLMFFFVNFWKDDRLTALSDNALSLARSVDYLYTEPDNDVPLYDSDSMLLIAGAFNSLSQSDDTEVFIVNSKGKILLCHDKILLDGEQISIQQSCILHDRLVFPQQVFTGETDEKRDASIYEGRIDGMGDVGMFVASAPFFGGNGAQYYVVCMQEMSTAYVPYTTEFVRMVLFTALIAVFITFLSSIIVSYRMVKPLKKMSVATKKYASGDFSDRINSVDNYNELAELVDSFNSMADNLAVIEESRSNFVANISHELKTPMTIISGFIDGILDGTIKDDDSTKYLQIVSDEVKRLSRLVLAMLNMSKIEAGKLNLSSDTVNLTDLLFRTMIGFEKIVNERSIQINGLDGLESVSVYADEALINQIIYNLIDNAVKFTPDGGEISFMLNFDKKNIILKIRNTGAGIPAEDCGLVFDRFYKVDKSRGLDSKSFGMGLYIVKSIIELHNGTISVNSEEGSFTEFIIKLPAQQTTK